MITPAFDLSQDSEFLILSIRVPYTRTSEFDLYIDGTDFKFFAKPYFLRLTLPGRIVEDGREKATFDIDKGLFSLRVPKETTGEHFEGLQLLTSLLAPKGSRSAKPLVEDVSTTCSNNAGDNEEQEEDDEEDEFDWQIEQQVYEEISEEELRGLNKYGFGNQRSGVFARLQEELGDVIDIKNPEGTTAAERRQRRLEAEASAFSADHYLADRFEDDEIQGLLKFKPWWTKLQPASDPQGEAAVSFTSDEKAQLRKFSNRSYLLDKTSRHQAWLSLVDILLAYSYEVRSTEGEHNVESPWTIRKLSGTLCWLETFNSLRDVLVSFGRRAVCFPLYRHFSMVTAALRDTVKILHSGRACVLKCLLDIHRVFRENDPAYILNDLYITDYCIWIQRVKSKKVLALATTLEKASLKKKDLELELEELEEAATLVAEEEEEEEEENEEGVSRSDAVSRGDSSSSESSDESDDSEAEGQDCTDPSEEEGGGRGGGGVGGGGGGTSKDSPPQPRPTNSTSSQVPRELPNTLLSAVEQEADAHPSVSPSSRRLIQDLEERVAEELRITQGSHSGDRAERSSSEANATTAQTEATPGRSCTRTLLEPSPRKNPLLIVQTQETDD